MRTTIRLDDALLADAKAMAARTHRTLTAVIEDALRETLARSRRGRSVPRVELPTHSARLEPGVDLDDSAALLELMEEDRAGLRCRQRLSLFLLVRRARSRGVSTLAR